MLLGKMNRLVANHKRKLGVMITGLIIVAFVGFFTPGFRSLFSPFFRQDHNTVGTVFGEKVTRDELTENIRLNTLRFAIIRGQSPDEIRLRDPEKNAFYMISILRAAEKMGICISADEVAKYIRDQKVFQTKGKFDLKKFNEYVSKKLKPKGYNKQELDTSVYQYLIVERLYKELGNSVITTPGEIRQFFEDMYTRNEVEAAAFNTRNYLKKVKVTEKDIKFHYDQQVEENKTSTKQKDDGDKKYFIKPKYKVELARFPYDDYQKQAEKEITEEDVIDFFLKGGDDQSKNLIKKENDKQREKMDKVLTDVSGYFFKKDKPKSYEDIKDDLLLHEKGYPSWETKSKLLKRLVEARKKELALDNAKKFASEVYMTIENAEKDKLKAFKDSAREKSGHRSITTDWIKASDKSIKNKDVGYEPDVIESIKTLNVEMPISDGTEGYRGAYVSYLLATEKARQAPFETVKEQVRRDVEEQKALNMAREQARNAALKITEELNAGKSFKDIDPKLRSEFKEISPFTTYSAPYYMPNGKEIAKLADKTPVGKVSEVSNTDNGAVFIYVVKKSLPDKEEFRKSEKMVTWQYKQQKQGNAVRMFENWLSKNSVNYMIAGAEKKN